MDKKKKIIIIAAAAAVLILAGIITAFATGLLGGREIEAPDFTNMTVEEARDYISENELDLRIKEGDEVISEDIEKGHIVSQDPAGGEMIREGGAIKVNVSIGLGDGTVPDLVGNDREDAESLLEAAGFTLGSVTEQASDEDAGTILSQDPSAGSEAEKGSAVNIVVSDGSKAQASVPYLIGRTISDARSALSNAGLQMGDISYDYSNTYAEGEIMWQQYDANAQLERGTSVRVRVSRGPEPTEATEAPDSEEEE